MNLSEFIDIFRYKTRAMSEGLTRPMRKGLTRPMSKRLTRPGMESLLFPERTARLRHHTRSLPRSRYRRCGEMCAPASAADPASIAYAARALRRNEEIASRANLSGYARPLLLPLRQMRVNAPAPDVGGPEQCGRVCSLKHAAERKPLRILYPNFNPNHRFR